MSILITTRPTRWRWPFDQAAYDCTPHLHTTEQAALGAFLDALPPTHWWPPPSHPSLAGLARLLAPIEELLALTHCPKERCPQVKRFLLEEMQRRHTSFWAWSPEQWVEIVGVSSRDFGQRTPSSQLKIRLYLAVMGYLLDKMEQVDAVEGISYSILATKVFGKEYVEEAVQRVIGSLRELDPSQTWQAHRAATVVGYALLANRSPLLADLTSEALETMREMKRDAPLRRDLVTLSQALVHLGVITQPLEHLKPEHSGWDALDDLELPPKHAPASPDAEASPHRWRIDVTAYDRRPQLTEAEAATLAVLEERSRQGVMQWAGAWRTVLERLLTPLHAVVQRDRTSAHKRGEVHLLLHEMHQRQTSFWAWSVDEWRDIVGVDQQRFHQLHSNTSASRLMLLAVAYQLCGVNELDLLSSVETFLFANTVFGAPRVEAALQQILGHVEEHLGYTPSHTLGTGMRNLLCLALAYNRSPVVSDLSLDLLLTLQRVPLHRYLQESLLPLSRLLASVGIVPRALRPYYPKDWGLEAGEPHNGPPQEALSQLLSVPGGEELTPPLLLSEPASLSSPSSASTRWQWPLEATAYDRNPQLTELERAELALMMDRFSRGVLPWRKASRVILQRLLHPLYDVFQVMGTKTQAYSRITHVLLEEMHQRQTSFWAWSEAEWLATIGQHEGDFLRRHGGNKADAFRQSVAAVGYLLCGFHAFTEVERINPYPLACKVFGTTQVDDAVQRIHAILSSWGYSPARYLALKNALCVVLLSNRSPLLSEVTLPVLEALQASQMQRYLKPDLVLISRALVHLGLLTTPLARQSAPEQRAEEQERNSSAHEQSDKQEGVPTGKESDLLDAQWLAWCQRWRATSTLEPKTRETNYYSLLQAGRWLRHTYPQVNTPAGWNREIAAEYVAAVCRMTVGQWSRPATLPAERIGKPIMPRQQAHLLSAIRRFFRDCQEWGWVPVLFDPGRCLATPRSVTGKIGPNPRVLADDVWAKLLAAGLSITAQDFVNAEASSAPRHGSSALYPIKMLRALVMIWLFGGLRSDEICRLRVGCARFVQASQNEEPSFEAAQKPPAQVCLLDIPVNKTETAFTKPVDLVVGEAIVVWEQVRSIQPAMLDPKTGEMIHYLFAFRLKRLAKPYLNQVVIPALCRKAGVPPSDARGNITSHRARSTIASQLANAKEPMSLFELQQWLGHKSPESTRNYLKSTPTKLAQAYEDADYFKRNLRTIEVLIDQEVIKSGAASLGEPWRYYDLGHGYCTYDFFDQCPHRMACAKCTFYLPKESSQAQILEAKANLLRMQQEMPLSEEERAAVEDGLAALDRLREQLVDVPTPAGPTPRQLEAGKENMAFIPTHTIQRRPRP